MSVLVNGQFWHYSSCPVVSDWKDFFTNASMVPRSPLSAIAAGDHSQLPQFGSRTLSIDGVCDLGSVCTATDKKPNKYIRTCWKQGVMSSTVTRHSQSHFIPTPIHGQIVSFNTSKRRKNSLSVNMPGCFQIVFEGAIVAVMAVCWLKRSIGHWFF